MTGRIVIDNLRPTTPTPGHPAKAVVGEEVPVRADIFKDGHDILAARALLWADGADVPEDVAPLRPVGDDGWSGELRPARMGPHRIVVEAWTDRHATWAHKARAKLAAGVEVDVEVAEGALLLEDALALADGEPDPRLVKARDALGDRTQPPDARLGPAASDATAEALAGPELADDVTAADPAPLWVDRPRALFGAWYELFPRSVGGLAGVVGRLPAIKEQGFDVVYLPPVHPIGLSFRKGPDNTLTAGPDDPGSPWAIGSAEGGHTALHPDLGTFEDFDRLVDAMDEHGLELALDYALQCSPDHPWVTEHPEWFHHRPDGSIAYAENPPKKYQDIYPINFWPDRDEDRVALWEACRDIFEFWIARGVHIFRVDNPHTKPIAFWEWVIPAVRAAHPEVLFLAEAFTRPKVMAKLAEVGFSQSYTYFTWRTEQHGEEGIWAYMEELTAGPTADYLRPNFWPNTPDILSGPLRYGPPAAFALRFVLAATLSPSYGIYSGYELFENQPASDTNEEYAHSEKYELRHRELDRPGTLAPLIRDVNAVRRRHPALQRLRNLTLHPSDNPNVIAYSKASADGDDVVLCVVTLDPHEAAESVLHLDLAALGLANTPAFAVHDELTGQRFSWSGPDVFVRLEPWRQVAHLFAVGRS